MGLEPGSDTDDEEATCASSTCSRSHHDSNPSLPGSVHESDSECESSCCEPSVSQRKPELFFQLPKWSRSTSLQWTDIENFRISKKLFLKANQSRKALCAAFLEVDRHSTGYLS